jgi:hypothetical protein
MMQTIYFVTNKKRIPNRDCDFKYPFFISISLKDIVGNGIRLYYEDISRNNIAKLAIELDNTINKLQIINSNQITIYSTNFKFDSYLQIISSIAAELTHDSLNKWIVGGYTIWNAIKIHIYNNSVVMVVNEDSCPRYFIHENNILGVLTDKNLIIIGFVINNISQENMNILKDYAADSLNQESTFPLYDCETTIMENKEFLIKKIIELQNVDHWKVLYYGLERVLIDKQFIMNYVFALVEQENEQDQFTLDIAGLLTNEIDKIPKMLEEKVGDRDLIMVTDGQFYNKIWFYLSLASDMCAERIID